MEIDRMENFEHLVIVTAQHGEKYIGWVPIIEENPVKYMENSTIELVDARLMVTQQQPRMNAQQQVVGVSTLVALLPMDVFPGPVKKLRLHPSAWYFPCENHKTRKKIKQLLESAEQNEKVNQAAEAGLHIPGRTA